MRCRTFLLIAVVCGLCTFERAYALGSSPLPISSPNGRVHTLAVVENTLFAAGDFSIQLPDGTYSPIHGFVAIDTGSGEPKEISFPIFENIQLLRSCGMVLVVLSEDVGQKRISALSAATGELLWSGEPNGASIIGTVNACSCNSSTLYIAGEFTFAAAPSEALTMAAIDLATGLQLPWRPTADGHITHMGVNGETVYVAGDFSHVNNVSRKKLAAVNAETAETEAWSPEIAGEISALYVDADTIYIGRRFGSEGLRAPLLAKIGSDGAVAWLGNVTGPGATVPQQCGPGDIIFACSQYLPPYVCNITKVADSLLLTGTFDNVGGDFREGVAALSSDVQLQAWHPQTAEDCAPWAASDDSLFIGGLGLLRYGPVSTSPAPADLRAVATKADSIVLAWSGDTESALSFRVYGGTETTTPTLVLTTGDSEISAEVNGLTPNTTYRFYVTGFDGHSETAASNELNLQTIPLPPTLGENIVCNLAPGVSYPLGTKLIAINPWGFGPGDHGGSPFRADQFRYYWEPTEYDCNYITRCSWYSGAMEFTPMEATDHWLNIWALNESGKASSKMVIGPFYFHEAQTDEGESDGTSEEGSLEGHAHSADFHADGRIELSDLLRVVQFFSRGVIGCDAEGYSEDGYIPVPTPENHACPPHSSDYNPQDWSINLNELMRLIQLYNHGSYAPCDASEDGFCLP